MASTGASTPCGKPPVSDGPMRFDIAAGRVADSSARVTMGADSGVRVNSSRLAEARTELAVRLL